MCFVPSFYTAYFFIFFVTAFVNEKIFLLWRTQDCEEWYHHHHERSRIGRQSTINGISCTKSQHSTPNAPISFDDNVVSVDYSTWPKPREIFQEKHRILRPGGVAITSFFQSHVCDQGGQYVCGYKPMTWDDCPLSVRTFTIRHLGRSWRRWILKPEAQKTPPNRPSVKVSAHHVSWHVGPSISTRGAVSLTFCSFAVTGNHGQSKCGLCQGQCRRGCRFSGECRRLLVCGQGNKVSICTILWDMVCYE